MKVQSSNTPQKFCSRPQNNVLFVYFEHKTKRVSTNFQKICTFFLILHKYPKSNEKKQVFFFFAMMLAMESEQWF